MDDKEFKQKLDRFLGMIERIDYEVKKSIEQEQKKQTDAEKTTE